MWSKARFARCSLRSVRFPQSASSVCAAAGPRPGSPGQPCDPPPVHTPPQVPGRFVSCSLMFFRCTCRRVRFFRFPAIRLQCTCSRRSKARFARCGLKCFRPMPTRLPQVLGQVCQLMQHPHVWRSTRPVQCRCSLIRFRASSVVAASGPSCSVQTNSEPRLYVARKLKKEASTYKAPVAAAEPNGTDFLEDLLAPDNPKPLPDSDPKALRPLLTP